MKFYRHVNEQLLRDLVKAYRTSKAGLVSDPAVYQAIEKIEAELKSIADEEAKERADEERKKNPPLTVQKVSGALRKAGLHIAQRGSGLAAVGGATGFNVTYGDYEFHSWVSVHYSFSWDWGHYKKWSKEQEAAEEKKEQNKQIDAAIKALEAAGLHVEPIEWMGTKRSALKVTA